MGQSGREGLKKYPPLPLLSCRSLMFVKENPDTKKYFVFPNEKFFFEKYFNIILEMSYHENYWDIVLQITPSSSILGQHMTMSENI